MFGKKKDLPSIDVEDIPEPPKIKSQVVEANLMTEDKGKRLEYLFNEYATGYHGIFNEQNMKDEDEDTIALNLLFAIYGELRTLRMVLTQKK